MAVTEPGRIVLYRHFEDDMGEEKAKILMDHLLPVGWTDLATKNDVSLVKQDLEAAVRELEYKLLAEMHKGFEAVTWRLIGAMFGFQGLMLAALKFV